MSPIIYDLIIIGAGPAGMTAAVYAARKQLNFIIISEDIGGQAARSGDIENYTGYQFVTGPELTMKFEEHINAFGIQVVMPERIENIYKDGKYINLTTGKAEYISRIVIIATGKRPRMLNLPGEKEFKNRGVTYCATCDGPLFKDKSVAVIGGGNSALDAVLQLMHICPEVNLINRGPNLTADAVMIEKVRAAKAVKIWDNSVPLKISGDQFVSNIDIKQNDKISRLNVQGVFVEIGLIPNSDCAGSLDLNEQKEIIVDCHNRTNIEGIFAAGDVTNVPEKQIIISCGEGSKACLSGFHYLSTHNL